MEWWRESSIYQVYPRSFQDSDGDGIGDLRGIIDRLDYITELGVDVLWVSPFFASPQADFGYDVTDYEAVSPEYGNLADAQNLIDQAHARGLKVMFDLVLNHTSDQHPWFLRSRGSRNNPKSDWYIWADGRGRHGRKPPNNWRSALEVKSAWQYSPERGQWFLATFLPFQPDLNWRNPEVRNTMFDTVRFWLERGVDGFRLDIFGMIMKDVQMRDNPLRPSLGGGLPRLYDRTYTENTAETVQLAKDLRAVVEEYGDPDRVLLGEVFGSPQVLRDYLGSDADPGLNLVFLFDFLTYKYDPGWFTETVRGFEASFPAPMVPTYVLENHDRSRSIDRVGGDRAKAGVLAAILLMLRGVPTIYYGQEIGMSNTPIPIRDAQDPVAATFFSWIPEFIFKRLPERLNRDEMRTPMQWDGSTHADFCSEDVRPWLPINENHGSVNVAEAELDPESLLHLYRALFNLRREHASLRSGGLELLGGLAPGVFGFGRGEGPDFDFLVYANLGEGEAVVPAVSGKVAVKSGSAQVTGTTLLLGPDSAVVIAVG